TRLNGEITDKIESQIEHLRPEIRQLFVTDSLFARHVRSCHQSLFARIFPMRLPSHSTHQTVRIKRQVTNCVDSFLFGLEIIVDRGTVWPGSSGVAHQMEVLLPSTRHHCQSRRDSVTDLGLDISQNRFCFKAV